jgi:fumarate reductase flavoprotein subunit
MTAIRAERLFADAGGFLRGVELQRDDGTHEKIGCRALVLACNGYGGNAALVREYIPEIADALYFGHPGNQGHAVFWGRALGARLSNLGAYQGHGSVATPHNILITWAVIMQGGIQVNAQGQRFSDESRGYSEQAADVLRQPGGIAWTVFDERIAAVARQFEDFRNAERSGAIVTTGSLHELATMMRVPAAAFAAEMDEVEENKRRAATDRFGRKFTADQRLDAPFYAVKVTGALFHTQGGLAVNADGQVKRDDNSLFPNLFAVGGAAAGVSGNSAAGYLSGNGLLTATVLGRAAGLAAARLVM